MAARTKDELEKLQAELGHAINANDGRCAVIENALLSATGLCHDLLENLALRASANSAHNPLRKHGTDWTTAGNSEGI